MFVLHHKTLAQPQTLVFVWRNARHMKTHPTAELLTANQIAQRLTRSTRSVIDKIAALGIQPERTTGHFKLYPPGVVETIGAAMRAPNQSAKPNTAA